MKSRCLYLLLFILFGIVGCGGRSIDVPSLQGQGESPQAIRLVPVNSPTPSQTFVAPGESIPSPSEGEVQSSSTSIPLPAGSVAHIYSWFAEAAATNIFGYYDPITGAKITLTADTLGSVATGESWDIGPYTEDKVLLFWFWSRWINAPGKIRIKKVSDILWYVECEDWIDDDYNDYIAKVVIRLECPSIDVFYFSVFNERWGKLLYDLIPYLIEEKGCALVSAAMVLRGFGVTEGVDGKEVNPRNLNEWLKYNKGYKEGNVEWEKIRYYSRNKIKFAGYSREGKVIDEELKAGHPVIAWVYNTYWLRSRHCVVVTGKKPDCKTHTINDSAYDKYGKDTLEEWARYGTLVKFKKVVKEQLKHMSIRGILTGSGRSFGSDKSIELLLIDPLGRRLGYDPDTKTIIEEIPDASYVEEGYGDLKTEEVWSVPKILYIGSPIDGVYKLKVIGRDSTLNKDVEGPYFLSVSTDLVTEPDCRTVDTKGFIKYGQMIDHLIEFTQAPGVDPKVFVIGKVDIDPNTLNLKSQGKFITAYIELPANYDVKDIDINSIRLEDKFSAFSHPTEIGDYDKDGVLDLMIKFDRQSLINYLKAQGKTSGKVILKVTGKILGKLTHHPDGTPYRLDDIFLKATDEIKVISE